MTDEIRPALSAEEWAYAQSAGFPTVSIEVHAAHGTHLSLKGPPLGLRDHATLEQKRDVHRVAALALYGQPFGFTWEIHDAIMWAISDYESEAGFMDEHQQREHAAMLRGLAIIASLLPPREEG